MPDPNGLQYMPGGKLYGLNSPFITSNNPPAPSTTNKLGYLGLSGVNSPTYIAPPPGVATVDNPGTFVASQPLVEHQGTRQTANADGTFNWMSTAPGNVGTTAANQSSNAPNYNVMTGAPGNTNSTTSATTPNSYGFNPIPGAGTANRSGSSSYGGWNPMAGAPGNTQSGLSQPNDNGLNYHSPQDQVANALFDQQQSMFSPYRPQGSGFFRSRF